MNSEYASKKYEVSFQEFITKNIDKIKIALIIHGISGKGKIGIGYHKPKKFMLNPKPKKKVKN